MKKITENTSEDNKKIENKLKNVLHNNIVEKLDKYIKQYKELYPNCSTEEIQTEIANTCGVTLDTVKKWGQPSGRIPHYWNLLALSSVLDCSIDELFKGIVLTKGDKKDLTNLGFSEKAAINLIENFSNEKMKKRISENINEKMGLTDDTQSNIKHTAKKSYLFDIKSSLPEIEYIDLLNFLIANGFINQFKSIVNEYRTEIAIYINDKYSNSNSKEKLLEFEQELTSNSLPALKKDYELIYKNLIKKFSDKSTVTLEELDKKCIQLFHKIIIDIILKFYK